MNIEAGCEYCKHHARPSEVIWDAHCLKIVGEDKPNIPFIKLSLYTRKNEAELIALSQGADNKQNAVTIPVKFCLNCGRKLIED